MTEWSRTAHTCSLSISNTEDGDVSESSRGVGGPPTWPGVLPGPWGLRGSSPPLLLLLGHVRPHGGVPPASGWHHQRARLHGRPAGQTGDLFTGLSGKLQLLLGLHVVPSCCVDVKMFRVGLDAAERGGGRGGEGEGGQRRPHSCRGHRWGNSLNQNDATQTKMNEWIR